MAAFAIALLDGLSYASTLFLMAAGLTLIFGVTRIVNFAHGSFFMLGALFSAHWLVDWFPAWSDSAWLYLAAMLLGAACAAVVGALAEWLLLRRLYGVPELYQLVATFGLSLAMHDAMRWSFGPDEVFAPRFPGLKGSIEMGGEFFPQYQLLTIALGPLVWLALHLALQHTRWGVRLRAATTDRGMLSALGVDAKPLMLLAVLLGCALAGLGGALQLPREPAHLQMDLNTVVETFVVVVTGGLGSIGGAFLAAALIGLVHSFGTLLLPQATLVLVFATMGVVLSFRPHGLLGQPLAALPQEQGIRFRLWPLDERTFWGACAVAVLLLGLAYGAGAYWQSLVSDGLILVIAGVSLQSMMALGAMVSFGHAAFFGLGAYAAAWVHLAWGWGLLPALLAATGASGLLAALVGGLLVRRSGVYLAMLSLALAQVLWATASQWVAVSGGDNGLIGLQLVTDTGYAQAAFFALLVLLALASIAALRRFAESNLGAALQALRDAPLRAAASGLPLQKLKWRVLLQSAMLAGLAGGLFVAHKGSVFPSVLSVSTSVDLLLVVLLGGLHQLWGTLAGALVLVLAASELGRGFDYWRGALGLLVMLIMVWAPSGLLGLGRRAGRGDSHG
jgi:branched-chain amino acid transport system permease protein